MSLSLTDSPMFQDREPTKSAQAVCVQTGIVTPLSFATPVETFSALPVLLGYAAEDAGGAVARHRTARRERGGDGDLVNLGTRPFLTRPNLMLR